MSPKQQLRIELKRQRSSLSEIVQQQESQKICTRLSALAAFQAANRIALYFKASGEVDLSVLWQEALRLNKSCYFPCLMQDKSLCFLPADNKTPLKQNSYQIFEPQLDFDQAVAVEHLDLIIMPLLAFDRLGTRLGMGAGYYDRTLKDKKAPLLIGVAYPFQEVSAIDRDPWDIPLDLVVTPDMTLDIRPKIRQNRKFGAY
jgi:5-formyltetrahydrofolate cyclo-ligase